MKSSTDTIISALRVLARDNTCLEEAARRLEELDRVNKNTLADLSVAIEQRDKARAEINRLEKLTRAAAFARDDAFSEVRRLKAELTESIQEPSRLEIAAMLLAAMCGSQYTWTNAEGLALRKADVLIELAKEAKS